MIGTWRYRLACRLLTADARRFVRRHPGSVVRFNVDVTERTAASNETHDDAATAAQETPDG